MSSYRGSIARTAASRSPSDATAASPASRPRSPTSCLSAANSARNGARVASGSAAAASSSAAMRGLLYPFARSRAVFPLFLLFVAGSHPAPSSSPARDGSSGPRLAAWCSAVFPLSSLAVASAPAATSSRTPHAAAPSGCVHIAARSSGV